ncbi:MAG: DUF4403 family protein [Alphaproteobacteria bacterium]|nr:DUF4403 family protein [Alphaproteobacteria bacterium]
MLVHDLAARARGARPGAGRRGGAGGRVPARPARGDPGRRGPRARRCGGRRPAAGGEPPHPRGAHGAGRPARLHRARPARDPRREGRRAGQGRLALRPHRPSRPAPRLRGDQAGHLVLDVPLEVWAKTYRGRTADRRARKGREAPDGVQLDAGIALAITVDYRIAEDWSLDPVVEVAHTWTSDPALSLGPLSFRVRKPVDKLLEPRLAEAAAGIRQRIVERDDLRARLETTWRELGNPRPGRNGGWIVIEPLQLAVSAPHRARRRPGGARGSAGPHPQRRGRASTAAGPRSPAPACRRPRRPRGRAHRGGGPPSLGGARAARACRPRRPALDDGPRRAHRARRADLPVGRARGGRAAPGGRERRAGRLGLGVAARPARAGRARRAHRRGGLRLRGAGGGLLDRDGEPRVPPRPGPRVGGAPPGVPVRGAGAGRAAPHERPPPRRAGAAPGPAGRPVPGAHRRGGRGERRSRGLRVPRAEGAPGPEGRQPSRGTRGGLSCDVNGSPCWVSWRWWRSCSGSTPTGRASAAPRSARPASPWRRPRRTRGSSRTSPGAPSSGRTVLRRGSTPSPRTSSPPTSPA